MYFLTLKGNFLLALAKLDACRNKYSQSLLPSLTGIDWMTADDILFRRTFEMRDTDSLLSMQRNTRQQFSRQNCEMRNWSSPCFLALCSIQPCMNSLRFVDANSLLS